MMAITKKLRAKIKCCCEDHYLELCQSFDGNTFVYRRYCYKCGKQWVHKKHLTDNCNNHFGNFIYGTDGSAIAVPRMTVMENNIMYESGTGYCYMYTLNKDGTIGDFIRLEGSL